MKREEIADLVIVGAGAAGGVFANVLRRAGKRVVVLEAGPARSQADMISSQIWARRLKWGGAPVLPGGEHPYGHNLIHGWGTGGAALHHYGTWPRLSPETFKLKSLYGVGLDWPIEYRDLQPWYDQVQEDVGLSGDRERETWAVEDDKPYPLPPLQTTPQSETLANGFNSLGKQVAPLPSLILSRPYRGRPACIYDGWCDAGCPTGALGNPLETYLGTAVSSGAELRNDAVVTRLISDRECVTAVEYVSGGEVFHLPARCVVLSGSVVQTPRILFNSVNEHHPEGLANGSGLLGHYLDVEVMISAFGLFEHKTYPYLGVNSGTLLYREKPQERHREDVFGGYQWQIGPATKPNDLFGIATMRPELFGAKLQSFLESSVHHLAHMVGFASSWSRRENRVEVTSALDSHGMRLARVVNSWPPESMKLWNYLREEAAAVMRAAGATEQWSGRPVSGHTVGGTIMGSDPDASVTDSYGRSHDIHNLFIAGGGILPSSGGNSPTYTIHALSLRAAEHLAAHWSNYANEGV